MQLDKINSSSDLLRSVEGQRQYNKTHLLLFCINFWVFMVQQITLTNAHDDVMPDSIPKYGNGNAMYTMYEH